jgi:hypothetical protein
MPPRGLFPGGDRAVAVRIVPSRQRGTQGLKDIEKGPAFRVIVETILIPVQVVQLGPLPPIQVRRLEAE